MPERFKDSAAASPDNPAFLGSSTSVAVAATPPAGDAVTRKKRGPRRRPRRDNGQQHAAVSEDVPESGEVAGGGLGAGERMPPPRPRQDNRQPKRGRVTGKERSAEGGQGGSTTQLNDGSPAEPSIGTNRRIPQSSGPEEAPSVIGEPRNGRRKGRFNATLTDSNSPSSPRGERQQRPPKALPPREDTLTNRLIHSLTFPPFAECPICFNNIRPPQATWSCSPSSGSSESVSASDSQCCYTPFHLKCISEWAKKSVNDLADAYRERGEPNKICEWRCPGCQKKRVEVPKSYRCFCGSFSNPSPTHISTPHSCGNPCSRIRACGHSCTISCHPGPCPPCQVMRMLDCYCGREKKAFRCVDAADLTSHLAGLSMAKSSLELSCGQVCMKPLSCGNHFCQSTCHEGSCADCTFMESSKCYCGKSERTLKCGEGVPRDSKLRGENGTICHWSGSYVCEKLCERPFDCGIHHCEKPCHPPSVDPATCPRSPSLVTHCPCGKQLLTELKGGIRKDCSDPIATCGNLCMRNLDGCDHVCAKACHTGPCPPCSISVVMPCRCGSITRAMPCHEVSSSHIPIDILCEKPCSALRNCGRHQCNRICCPLASVAVAQKGKGKKRAQAQDLDVLTGDEAKWHECDLICGKYLGCGNHRCEQRDHKGPCRPCLQSSFDEMICFCGRTILEPPVPCGTRISCSFPCTRPPPLCGHPRSPHTCHEDPTPCPPCPFLTSKICACGKGTVKNVRCSQEKVSCGTKCDKMLGCGFHRCERLCHGDECGSCNFVCGKPRKHCLPLRHGCTAQCHAPAACSEDEPCTEPITLECPCGRIKKPAVCGRSNSNPGGREALQQVKCTSDCAVAKRNARLAEALGISPDRARDGPLVTYSDSLTTFARSDARFCVVVEKTFADFLSSDKKAQLLPHMTELRRRFVVELAHVYRFDTQLVDQEPNRSVQIIRRVDTRVPKPLLSSVVTASKPAVNAGSVRLQTTSVSGASTTGGSSGARGWTSVVASTGAPSSARASPWGLGSGGATGSQTAGRTEGVTRTPPPPSNSTRLVLSRKPTPSQLEEGVPDSWESDEA